ncbi:MauE/DoxX family redox-associated membrane protein [Pedobacter gandavensis]|uniref:MauE/DoxX family redox-associated membrane protein n=1 Tax=Pedobacter gandavensis TaxID=2679963 RepID=UPI002931D005|nr:MauE/DoxX family redox-associated membrane protein [Pedobacter gandavensis]
METTLKKTSRFHLSDKAKEITIDAVAYIFIALFIYTATDKFMTMDVFIKFISRLDMMHSVGKYVAWLIPITEVVISILLMVPITRRKGLIASGILMTVFTLYLIYMKIFIEVVPCHCGGVISSLTWMQHIWFNIIFIVLAGIAISFSNKRAN